LEGCAMWDWGKGTWGDRARVYGTVPFWQTATIRTLDNGEIELTATINGKVKIVTKAFVRRHLQLADADGISSLPTTEIFEQLSLMGAQLFRVKDQHTQLSPITYLPVLHPPHNRQFHQHLREQPDKNLWGYHYCHWLRNRIGSGNIDNTPFMPYDSPLPRVNTLGSDEGSMTQKELMVFCTTLSKKVESLEIDLKQTKKIYGAAYTKLIKKERKIDAIDQDPAILLVQHDVEIQGRYGHDMEFNFDFDTAKEVSTVEKDVSTAEPVYTTIAAVTTDSVVVSTASPTRNTRVSTTNDITMAETLVYIRKSAVKDKGKGKMAKSETIQTKTKLQQEQERLGFETAVRLQDELDEEERQRIARVHESAISFNVEEWEDIQARVELMKKLINQGKRYSAAQRDEERRNKQPTQAQQRTYMSNYIKHIGSYTLQQLRGYSFDEIKTLFEATMRRVNTFVPIESEVDRAVPELAAESSKRYAEEELDQESSKRQKTGESSELAEEPKDKEADELSQEELQQMIIIVPEQRMNVEALQTKCPIIVWEIYTEGTRKY
nr:hypothetical protein [Tanacetum cinerariifolium]